MVRIRLRRVGAKGQPSYRIVVTDQRTARNGRFIEKIGFYNPRTEPATMELDEARALHWLNVGAQPSEAVMRIIVKLGTYDRLQRLKAGEDMEALVIEAEAEAAQRPLVNPRTRRDDLLDERVQAKAEARARAQAEAEVEVEVEEVEEAPPEPEAEAE